MRVLVACEFSGIVRSAFVMQGHDVWSCDLLPTEMPCSAGYEYHYQGDVRDILDNGWDLIIAHPPCTYLASSGARWWSQRQDEQEAAIGFFMRFTDIKHTRIAIENPIGIMSTVWRKPDQIIQPWMFGHGETKATCLWLKGLPQLVPTRIVPERYARVHLMSESKDRWKNRSRTPAGIAAAMALQWSDL